MDKELKAGFVEGVIETGKDFAKNRLGELIPKLVSDTSLQFGLEATGGMAIEMIPLIGRLATSYLTNRKIKNEHEFISEIAKHVTEIEENMASKTVEQKEILDEVAAYAYEKAVQTSQTEKIAYIVNGFVNLTKIEELSKDVAYIYYDTLDKMTFLDLCVLKEYGSAFISAHEQKDVITEFGLEYSQYNAVKQNLYRLALLEDASEEKFDKYFKDFVKAFNGNMKILKSLKNLKEFGKLKDIKEFRGRERLKISKFGIEFLEFFCDIR